MKASTDRSRATKMSDGLGHLVEEGFADALTYDTYRPYYPVDSLKQMLEKLKIIDVAGARILDIGAGTGKLTEQLVNHDRSYDIIAVEPHIPMRQVLESKALKGVKIVDGTAANLEGIEEDWADAVVVAQVRCRLAKLYVGDTDPP